MSDKFLLDTSALWNIRSNIDPEAIIEKKVKLYIIQLTPFEFGNILWKSYIRKILTKEEIEIEMRFFEKLIETGILEIINVKDYSEISRASLRLRISFYDASYVVVAKSYDLTLVTDDNGLFESSKLWKVKVIKSSELKKIRPEIFLG